jgi:hypothetical protein
MLTPSLTIRPGPAPEDAARFSQGTAIAFDAAGNLWLSAVANALRFDDVADLRGDVSGAPAAIVSTGEAYASLAFDVHGDLWITAAKDGDYFALRFAGPTDLRGVSSPVPAARVRIATQMATFAGGMGFDAQGALWIAVSNQLLKLTHAETLVGEVSPTPAVALGQVAFPDLASKIAVQPTPAGLPLFEP